MSFCCFLLANTSKPVQYVLLFVFLLLFLPTHTLAQSSKAPQNVTIPIDSPQLIYTPFICDGNKTLSNPTACNGGWETKLVNGRPTISTAGPDPATGEIIPQMFFQFRGSALYFFTSRTSSNASANITITNNLTTISAVFDSSLGVAAILNLSPSLITTFALTFLPNNPSREFVVTAVNVTIPNGSLSMTLPILPTMTLPSPSSPPVLSPTMIFSTRAPTVTANADQPTPDSSSSARRNNIALAVGVTLGLGLGLTSVTAAGYWWYKQRRRPRWVRTLVN